MSFGQKLRKRGDPIPRISDAEWVVMRVLWQLKGGTAKQVVKGLRGGTEWKPKTVHTLISRLVQKGALKVEKSGREYRFEPLIGEQACRLSASRSFLERVFDGEVAPLL